MINKEENVEDELPQRVPDFYRGLSVLVTGGSGFVGRVLVEKLLRSCPDIHTIFLLLRTRKGVPPDERIKKLTDVPLFDRLRAEQPNALAKIQVVAGDIAQPGLGLSAEDAQLLRERVSVVFHSAANVRFDNPLEVSVRSNMCSTFELLELATQMSQLKVFVQVSTTFCNVGEKGNVYEEKIYPTSIDWRSIVKAVDHMDPFHFRIFSEKLLGTHKNPYDFTKFLSEHIVNEYKDRFPIGIMRLSGVIPTFEEPVPSWIDNFNGVMGIMVGASMGIVHTAQLGPDTYANVIPCDTAVKGTIISSCDIARRGVGEMSVYHASRIEEEWFTFGDILKMSFQMIDDFPFKDALYYPRGIITASDFYFYILFVSLQLFPAILIDAFFRVTGRKPMLVRLQRRLYLGCKGIALFNTQPWNFLNKRFVSLDNMLVKSDRKDFAYNMHLMNPRTLMSRAFHGMRIYLQPQKDADLPIARRQNKRQYIVHLIVKTLFFAAVMWIMLSVLGTIFWRVR